MGWFKEKEGDCFDGRQLRALIAPLLVEQFLAISVGMADSIMVASVGEAAVSGVSLMDTIFVLLINLFTALATGGAVVCGQYIGKKRLDQAAEAAGQLVLFTVALSLAVMALVYLSRGFILQVVFGSISPEVERNCDRYLLIVTASIPFLSLYNAGAAVFRAQGDSATPMRTSMLMNGINLLGNALFLYGLGWGVEGAALPTLISRVVAGLVIVLRLCRPGSGIRLTWGAVRRFSPPLLKKILRIGVPNGLENSMFQLGKILVLSLVADFGTASIAANAVSNTIAVFVNLPGMAINQAVLSVTARCVGAGAFDQVRHYTRKLTAVIYALMACTCAGVLLALPLVLKAYRLSPEATGMTREIIWYFGICAVLIWPLSFTIPNMLRACNDVRFCMWVSIFSMWIFRIGFSYVLGRSLHMGVLGVWVAMTVDWAVRSVFFVARYLSGRWERQAFR